MCESPKTSACVKVGDKIRITTPWTRYEPYGVGDILYVDGVYDTFVTVTGLVPNEETVIHYNEFEVI
jgi:hypothetical protein